MTFLVTAAGLSCFASAIYSFLADLTRSISAWLFLEAILLLTRLILAFSDVSDLDSTTIDPFSVPAASSPLLASILTIVRGDSPGFVLLTDAASLSSLLPVLDKAYRDGSFFLSTFFSDEIMPLTVVMA